MGQRHILHCDCNCFYASVEMQEHPELRGKSIAVCGDPEARHGIVLTASYPAKRMGVKTGMPIWEAKQHCRDLIIVPAKAEFGVRIAGDSMEPRFVNGQTVWVKAAQDANNGDIVLCTLNDQGYCKKLRKDENGIALISLNKKYAPIPVREEDEFRIAGIVVG